MKELDEDIVGLLMKRAYDMAGLTDRKVKVTLNGKQIKIKNFQEYIDLYITGDDKHPKIVETKHSGDKSERWEIAASLSDGHFEQVSFVNSICTSKGGTHVDYIAN